MRIGDLKEYFEKFKPDQKFKYALSEPFSWRGSYDEVAFAFEKRESSVIENLEQINKALTGVFHGYKGGEYTYTLNTTVNFEEDYSSWTDGSYALDLLIGYIFQGIE